MNEAFTQRWLETQCSLLPGVHSAIFMVPNRKKNMMRPLAKVPANLNSFSDFTDIVKYTLKKRSEMCIPNAQTIDQQSYDFFAYPVYTQKTLLGILVIKIKHLEKTRHKAVFNSLGKSVRWLGLGSACKDNNDEFYTNVVELLAASFEQQSYHETLIRMVTELTQTLNCDRIAFAEFQNHHCQIVALSNSANFDQRSNLMQKIADAMDESIEQDNSIVFPDPTSAKNTTKLIQRAHQELARKFGSGSIFTVPLIHQQQTFGAVTLLRSEENPFDNDTLQLCQQTLALITPYLALKRDDEKSLMSKITSRLKVRLKQLLGFKFLKLKLIAIAAVLVLTASSFIESDFRVSADAILEGKVQRIVAAPVSGYLFSASVRAGDTVKQGDLMASLNDSELRLELTRLTGELQKSRRKYREAQSTRGLVKVRIISEQIKQTNAEIELTHQQLDNIHLKAPFDGVIIEGDLSQLLGSPVERGETLFKIAPLEGYRIILKIDESDISYIKPGQSGILALSSLTQQNYPLTIEKITAVAKAENGANIFRVEASLDNPPDLIRPGMQGVGKINISKARLVWIWTHEITDWLRLWVWSWWP